MIIELERRGKPIAKATVREKPAMYAGSLLVHELVVRVPLYDGEYPCVSFRDADAGKPITRAVMLKPRCGEDGSKEYYTLFPNAVMTAGNKQASVYLLDKYAPTAEDGNGNTHRVITSADVPFQVYPSSADTDFTPVEEDVAEMLWEYVYDVDERVTQTKNQMVALLQAPDVTEADMDGRPMVTITEDGRLKFSNLKGKPGVNATVQWGVNGASPISTLEWKKA